MSSPFPVWSYSESATRKITPNDNTTSAFCFAETPNPHRTMQERSDVNSPAPHTVKKMQSRFLSNGLECMWEQVPWRQNFRLVIFLASLRKFTDKPVKKFLKEGFELTTSGF